MNYIGFRYWRVRSEQGTLHMRGLVVDVGWEIGKPTLAVHFNSGIVMANYHEAPKPHCLCGIHAWRNLKDAVIGDWGQGQVHAHGTRREGEITVAGAVLTGGRICLHGDEGLRAEQAIPVGFAVYDRKITHPLVTEISEAFGVPVFNYQDLETYAFEFGDRMPRAGDAGVK